MKEIYYKYKIFLIPGIVSLISIAVLIFVVYPQASGYFQEINKIEKLKNNVEILNNKAKELQKIDEVTRRKDLVVALTILPTERDVPIAMSTLQSLIARSNLILKNTTYSPQSKSKENNNFMFTISVLGSLSSIKSFLGELQNGSRIFKVQSITLNFQNTNSLAEVSIPLLVFYEPVPKTLVTLDQPIPTVSEKDEQLIRQLSKAVFQAEITSTSSAVPLGKVDPFE